MNGETFVKIVEQTYPTKLVEIFEPGSQNIRKIMCTPDEAIEIAHQIVRMLVPEAI